MSKTIIVFPFWKDSKHVGNYRVENFIRYLKKMGHEIVVVSAGNEKLIKKQKDYTEIIIKDPLGIHRKSIESKNEFKIRKPNKFRRELAYLLLIPDPSIVWAFLVYNNKDVAEHCKNADFIISTSPPESSHIVSYFLARKYNLKLVIDMRDGWLDEPLKPVLRKNKWRQFVEEKQEKKTLSLAHTIFVTSENWRELLIKRIPEVKNIVFILTNGYPIFFNNTKQETPYHSINLVHTGRFTGSSSLRQMSLLFKPLIEVLPLVESKCSINLYGEINETEISEMNIWINRFMNLNWELKHHDHVSREEVFKILSQSSGLLLLSASNAAIPSKFFEYLAAKKPILVLTLKDSSLWKICEKLEQTFLIDYMEPIDKVSIRLFIENCAKTEHNYKLPFQFSHEYLENVFCKSLLRAKV